MNFKDFKKVSEDNKTAVLKHPMGHEIKIAKGQLSSKMKSELGKLPLHAAGGTGEVGQSSEDTPDDSDIGNSSLPKGVNININAQPQQPQNNQPFSVTPVEQPQGGPQAQRAPSMASQAPQGLATPQQPVQQQANPMPQQSVSSQDLPQQPAPPEEDQSQAAQTQRTRMQAAADYKQQHAQEMGQEDAAFQQDLQNGHITPETYHSLFAKKDTLGKIGTLFGLMLSGAGSGLAHQQNAVLGMMDNQIKNDLDAQIKSKENAQNFLKINQGAQKVKGEIGLMGAQQKASEAESNIKNYSLSLMQARRAALHDMVMNLDKLPPGSKQYLDAQQLLGRTAQAIGMENLNTADVAAAQMAFMHNNDSQDSSGPVNYKRLSQLERDSQGKVPGAPSEQDLGEINKEATGVEENEALRSAFNDSFQKLNKLALAGKLSPHYRAAEVNAISAQLAHQTVHRFSNEEAKTQAEGMFPSAGDWTGTRTEKLNKSNEFFDTMSAGTPKMKQFSLRNAPVSPQKSADQQSTGPKDGDTQKSKSGKSMIYSGGHWRYN